MLSLEQLEELEIQFPEVYEDIFNNKEYMLWSTLQAKFRAFELLETKNPDVSRQHMRRTTEALNEMKAKKTNSNPS